MQRVFEAVRTGNSISRADLARMTLLSPPTVSAVVSDLIRAGLVTAHGEGDSNGGRKPRLLRFNAKCGCVLAVRISATSVELAIADMNGTTIEREEFPIEDSRPELLLARIAITGKALAEAVGRECLPLLAAAVAAPGMTDVAQGVVLEAANLDQWTDVPVKQILSDLLSIPVTVDNDINLAAIGEHWRGGVIDVRNFIFISLDTGIGAGIFIENRIHRGHRWYAGEISHLNVDYREWSVDFAAAGYLETYVAAPLPKVLAQAPRRGTSDGAAIERLGAAVANIVTILDPEAVVFGGQTVQEKPDLIERVREVAARIAPNCPEFLPTRLGLEAPLVGCVRFALDVATEVLRGRLERILAAA